MFQNLFNVQQGNMASAALDAAQAEELAKTMTVGHAYLGAPQSLVGLAAQQLESIDGVLRSVTYDASHLQFWPSIPQDRAYSLVEQYVRTNSYGDGGSPYIPEAGSPVMNDSEYNRHAQKVVFFATRRGVSLPSTLVKMNFGGDIESKEAEAGTLWMLERLERELYKGLADFSSNGAFTGNIQDAPAKLQNLNLAGLEQQIRAGDTDYTAQALAFDGFGGQQSVVFNREGELIDETVLEDIANVILENFGRPSEVHAAPKQISDFVKQFLPLQRVNPMGIQDARSGYVVKTFATTAGDLSLKANIFLKPKESARSANARSGVPAAPASAAGALATDGDSKLKNGDAFIYQVTAANEQGEGAAYAESASVAVDADGKNIKLTIAQPASGPAPTHYAVYRTSASGSGARKFVGFVARSGANTIFCDRGARVEGSATAYVMDMRSEILVWKQLAPLMRLNLAQVSMAREFILWMAGCLIVAVPRKLGIIENIGRAS